MYREDWQALGIMGACLGAAIGLGCLIVFSENAEMARFMTQCAEAGKSPAECEMLASIKRSADDAAITSAAAVGFAAGRVGR